MNRRPDGRYIFPESWTPLIDGILTGIVIVCFVYVLVIAAQAVELMVTK